MKSIIPLVLIVLAPAAWAHEPEPTYDRVSLSVSAEREVDNDTLVATMFAEHQAQRQQEVAEIVNEAMRWALEKAKAAAGVKVQTTQYHTSPMYDKRVITGWRARQSLRLESTDAQVMSDLVGALQERLSIASMDYTVSKSARDAAEESLTSAALAQFRRRADLIARDLARRSYRIVQLDIGTHGGQPPPIAYAARTADMEAAVAPAIEAGVQTVVVNVSGTIEVDSGSIAAD